MLHKLNLKKIILGIIAGMVVPGFIIGLRYQGSFEQIELLAYDFLVRLDAKSGLDERIAIVGIDDNTLQKLNSDKISDATLQQVLATIKQYQPRAIGVDIIRDIPIGEGKEELIKYVNNIYEPLETAIKPIIFPCALPSENKPNGIAPPPVIDLDSAVGFVDLETDPQNIFGGELVRRASITSIPVNTSKIDSEGQFDASSGDYLCTVPFSFSFITALSYVQAQQIETLLPNANPDVREFLDITKISEGEVQFKSVTFKPLQPKTGSYQNLNPSIYQHLIDYGYTQPGEIISLTKVLDNEISPQQFKNKIVLIGYTTKEDIHQTPFGFRPGVFIHGWIISQLLSNVLDRQPQIWTWTEPVEWLWIIAWGIVGSIIALGIRPISIFVGGIGIAIAILGCSCWLLFTQQGWIPLIPAMFSVTFAGVLVKAIDSKFSPLLVDNPIIPASNRTSTRETEPLATVVERLIDRTPEAEREPLRTVVERLIDNTPETERKPLRTVVERLTDIAPEREREPLATVVERLIDNTPETERKPLRTVVEKLIDSIPETEREPLRTVVEKLTNPSKRPAFRRPEDPFVGQTVGDSDRYLLQKLLGQGGMSKVYIALDKKLSNKKVAIKIMTSYSSANNQHLNKRFTREVESLCILNHPNIIQITDFGLTPQRSPFSGDPFYVMEYFVGQTLKQLLDENNQLDPNLALKIGLKICYGLKYAHNQGIIHRDLKPDNIFLVSGSTVGEIVKIIDFGIAKKIEEENDTKTSLTMVNTFIGTYRYASPEQCRGISIDSRTDIYSLGMVLYEMLSGNNPYNLKDDSDTTNADWSVAHRRETAIPLKEQPGCENIPLNLENIVMKCLEKSPQDRFKNIEELEQALRNCL
ncbi:MAG: CHASE2 domain-containing protein [Xenococcaceae cyanobacterium]